MLSPFYAPYLFVIGRMPSMDGAFETPDARRRRHRDPRRGGVRRGTRDRSDAGATRARHPVLVLCDVGSICRSPRISAFRSRAPCRAPRDCGPAGRDPGPGRAWPVARQQIASRLVSGEDFNSSSLARGCPVAAGNLHHKGRAAPERRQALDRFYSVRRGPVHPGGKEGADLRRDGFRSPIPDYAPGIGRIHPIPMNWPAVTHEDMQEARAEWTAIFTP